MSLKYKFLLCAGVLVCSSYKMLAQHDHAAKKNAAAPIAPMSFAHVRSEALTDPALQDYKMESSVMTLAPGAEDTVTHQHDCELFGYVLEGAVQIGLGDKKNIQTYEAGQMFYEKRNIYHTLTRNPSKEHSTRILLLFIIKNGRNGYTPVYPQKTNK